MVLDVLKHELDWGIDCLESALVTNFLGNTENGEYRANHTITGILDNFADNLVSGYNMGLKLQEVSYYQNKVNKILEGYA